MSDNEKRTIKETEVVENPVSNEDTVVEETTVVEEKPVNNEPIQGEVVREERVNLRRNPEPEERVEYEREVYQEDRNPEMYDGVYEEEYREEYDTYDTQPYPQNPQSTMGGGPKKGSKFFKKKEVRHDRLREEQLKAEKSKLPLALAGVFILFALAVIIFLFVNKGKDRPDVIVTEETVITEQETLTPEQEQMQQELDALEQDAANLEQQQDNLEQPIQEQPVQEQPVEEGQVPPQPVQEGWGEQEQPVQEQPTQDAQLPEGVQVVRNDQGRIYNITGPVSQTQITSPQDVTTIVSELAPVIGIQDMNTEIGQASMGTTETGETVYSVAQVFNNIPVYGRRVELYPNIETGLVTNVNTSYLSGLQVNTQPTIDENQAILNAQATYGGEDMGYTYANNGLVVQSLEQNATEPKLAYDLVLSNQGFPTTRVQVDAHTGAIVYTEQFYQ